MRFRGQRMGLKSGLAAWQGPWRWQCQPKVRAQIAQYNFANADATGVTLATMETPTSVAANSSAGSLLLQEARPTRHWMKMGPLPPSGPHRARIMFLFPATPPLPPLPPRTTPTPRRFSPSPPETAMCWIRPA